MTLAHLLEFAHSAAPVELPIAIHDAAQRMGATDVQVLLVDWQQEQLMPLDLDEPDQPPSGAADPNGAAGAVAIEGTTAGRAFTAGTSVVTPVSAAAGGGALVETPSLDGIERLGVLRLRLPLSVEQAGEAVQAHCRRFADLVTQFVATKGRVTDEYHRVRQSRPMTLAAQIQWQVLPPMTAHVSSLTIAGQVEPAYEVGGDAFDYALNRDRTHFAIFDAMGHGVSASVTTALAIGAYRNSRRHGHELAETLERIDTELATEFPDDRYVTAMLGEVDQATGRLLLVNAGHLQPMLLRGRHVHPLPHVEPTLPLGMGLPERPPPLVTEARLQPGDRLFLLTDGILDATNADGVPFGEEMLAGLIERAVLNESPLVELVRSIARGVFDYQHGQLHDDASLLVLDYLGLPGQRPPAGQAPEQ
ncbi:PP2C family protein-serine/threonine phosphatase [Kineococcus xinjiangensis]|uniref:PP2C family protein-serine/threonine phosphatase n=1 Tax=Kineococcus xinjiangensis TaxID=512762 RepID=UPI000CECDC0D|nr:PP2C family protein-serine/threonine phosphatase [Kineococcus xinjiangensis]